MGAGARDDSRNPSQNHRYNPNRYADFNQSSKSINIIRRSLGIPNSRKIKVLVAHDNRKDDHTTKSHKFAEFLNKTDHFSSIYDKQRWKKGEKTSTQETNRRESTMVRQADIVVRITPSVSKNGKRNQGALREIIKAKREGKPIITIIEKGGHHSPYSYVSEKRYHRAVDVHLQENQHISTGYKGGLSKLSNKLSENRKSSHYAFPRSSMKEGRDNRFNRILKY